jgi:hypothetical protein
MPEIWLRANRRVLLMGMILPAVLIAVGVILGLGWLAGLAAWVRYVGWTLFGIGLILAALITLQLRLPRLAYANGQLLVNLHSGGAIPVPVDCVECFFLGKGTGQLPGAGSDQIAVQNLVIRLAEKATDYHHRDVRTALGRWEDGYITIHGAWCEPLRLEIIRRLNDRLAEAQRAKQEASP